MTPLLVKMAIDFQAVGPLNAHIGRTDNPHQVTKSQVGLGSVENYPVASTAEAQTGTATNRYMTPALVKSAITANTSDFSAHIGNTNNPHQTTKAQVNLGNVQNYPMASTAEAQAGNATDRYMSPQLTNQAIQSLAIAPLTAQINQRVVTGSNGQLNQLLIGSSGLWYQDTDGSISLRVAGSRFFQSQAGGDFVVYNGRVIASGGFKPSDRRFKRDISKAEARPLWRGFNYKTWTNINTGEVESGAVAQDLRKVAPDRVTTFNHAPGGGKRAVKRLAVDYVGAAFEMSIAAGLEIDRLRALLGEQLKIQGAMTTIIGSLESRLAALEARG
jgi:hypothetical protein